MIAVVVVYQCEVTNDAMWHAPHHPPPLDDF